MKAVRVRLGSKGRTDCLQGTGGWDQRCGTIRSCWGWHSPPAPITGDSLGPSQTFRCESTVLFVGVLMTKIKRIKAAHSTKHLLPRLLLTALRKKRHYFQCISEGCNLPLTMHLGISELAIRIPVQCFQALTLSHWPSLRGHTWPFAHNQVHLNVTGKESPWLYTGKNSRAHIEFTGSLFSRE